jgi:hypothetical protein
MAWCLVKHRDNFTLPFIPTNQLSTSMEESPWEANSNIQYIEKILQVQVVKLKSVYN